jgi:glycosyltransferase involved in cell wall biosynthesis
MPDFMKPKVTFIVPCYRLAHLLPECVDSILQQTLQDFEILIMDDCSPDNTPEVAASFRDPRVVHVRNNPNLGHLRNYNKGISLAKGDYIWLISADDRLRVPYVLERYVSCMEQNPGAGYVFCPGIGLENGLETGLLRYAFHGDEDRLFRGREFFVKLLKGNSILSASGMVRREVYEKLDAFPLDMPFGGDWYLWLLFALHYDVAYLGEPMVLYRQHSMSMTNLLQESDPRICTKDDLRVLWRIKRCSESAGYAELTGRVDDHLVDRASLFLSSTRNQGPKPWYSLEDFEQTVMENSGSEAESRRIRARVLAKVADESFWQHDYARARSLYALSVLNRFFQPKVWLQQFLLRMGEPGIRLRNAQLMLRRRAASLWSRSPGKTSV